MKFVLTETQRNSDDSFNYDVTGDFPVSFRDFSKWVLDNENSFRVDFQIVNKCYGGLFRNYIEFEREKNNREWHLTKYKLFNEIEDKQIVKCFANGGWGQMSYFCTLEESEGNNDD